MASDDELLTAHLAVFNNHMNLLARFARQDYDDMPQPPPERIEALNMPAMRQRMLHCMRDAETMRMLLRDVAAARDAVIAANIHTDSEMRDPTSDEQEDDVSADSSSQDDQGGDTAVKQEPVDRVNGLNETGVKHEPSPSPLRRIKRERLSDEPFVSPRPPPSNQVAKRRRVTKEEPDVETAVSPQSRPPIKLEPSPDPTPKIERDEIDQEVEQRLRANEDRRRRNATGEPNPSIKRKRESGGSTASRESIGRKAKKAPADEVRPTGRRGGARKRARGALDQIAGLNMKRKH